jgi:hypothetical protein
MAVDVELVEVAEQVCRYGGPGPSSFQEKLDVGS